VPRPALGDVFNLACGIVRCCRRFARVGWLHKDICSENILIFSPAHRGAHRFVASSVTGGFSNSRPEESETMSLGPGNAFVSIKNPKYIETTTEFEGRCGFCSAGIVLLEQVFGAPCLICSTPKFFHIPPTKRQLSRIEVLFVKSMFHSSGIIWANPTKMQVAFCLDVEAKLGSFKDDEGRWAAQQASRDNVVDPLAWCFA
jgi:hypothetical protein